jgi:FeS assembly SUF system regulator
MLRMSKLADYAALMLATMAERPAETYTAAGIAAETGVNLPTASKLLKMLVRAQLVASQRGSHGGYTLGRVPSAISAVDVIEAVEGPLAMTECTLAPGLCDLEPTCQLGSQWQSLSAAIRRALAEITLADLIGDPIVPALSLRRRTGIPAIHMEQTHGNA